MTAIRSLDLAGIERAYAATAAKLDWMGTRYPVYFTPPEGIEIVRSDELLSDENITRFFERAILEWTDKPEVEDRRAAASRFMRRYLGTVTCAALIPLCNGVAWDVSLRRVSTLIRQNLTLGIVLDPSGMTIVTCEERPTTWPVPRDVVVPSAAELREHAVANLIRENVLPVFERIVERVHISANLLWATLFEQLEQFYELVFFGLGADAFAPLREDRDAIFFGPTLPGVSGPNPLLGLFTWERVPGYRLPLPVRHVCCAQFVVKSRAIGYCRNCALISQEERVERYEAFIADTGATYLKGTPLDDGRPVSPRTEPPRPRAIK